MAVYWLAAPPNYGPAYTKAFHELYGELARRARGARVLDLYSGTGAFAIEALSRGASAAVLVETNRACLAAIRSQPGSPGAAAIARKFISGRSGRRDCRSVFRALIHHQHPDC